MSREILRPPPAPPGRGGVDKSEGADIVAGFEGMLGELKEKAADKWAFWEKALADLSESPGSFSLSKTEPVVLMPMGKNPAFGQKLIVKCDNAAVRAEMHMHQGSLIEAVNKYLPKDKQVARIIFR